MHAYQNSNQHFRLKPVYILEVDTSSDEEYSPVEFKRRGIMEN
jgi:hypothetical protein